MDNKKMKISQDYLYKYFNEHNIKMSRVAELMDKSPAFVTSCFRHDKNRHGNPRTFSIENIQKINEILPVFAHELRSCLMSFGTEQMYTNKHGRTYDPGMIEPLKELGNFLNLTKLVERLLGWNKNKKTSVITDTMSKAYGNISADDVDLINSEILSIAGVLGQVEVVPDEDAFGSNRSSEVSTES